MIQSIDTTYGSVSHPPSKSDSLSWEFEASVKRDGQSWVTLLKSAPEASEAPTARALDSCSAQNLPVQQFIQDCKLPKNPFNDPF